MRNAVIKRRRGTVTHLHESHAALERLDLAVFASPSDMSSCKRAQEGRAGGAREQASRSSEPMGCEQRDRARPWGRRLRQDELYSNPDVVPERALAVPLLG